MAVFLFATVNLALYAIRSASTKRMNEELQAIYGGEPESTAPEAVPATSPTPAATAAEKPELQDAYQYIGDRILPEAAEMLEKNPDTVAWLRIPGVVDLPVVYRDNTYYLDHDFYGRKNESGTLFLDEAHPLTADTQYMVIHGHAMHDGSMFGLLTHYRKRSYIEEHSTVYFNTLYSRETYEAVGVLILPVDIQDARYVAYAGTGKFKNLNHFYSFADKLRENALHWKEGAELQPSDALLALSTCYDEERIVVICRRTGAEQ